MHLNADAVDAIRQSGLQSRDHSNEYFPRKTAARFDNRSWFLPCLAEAKITGAVWHSNRHTYCSWLAMAGATIKEIQEAAGHKTITMAARYSTFHRPTSCPWWNASSEQAPNRHLHPRGNEHAPEHAPRDFAILYLRGLFI